MEIQKQNNGSEITKNGENQFLIITERANKAKRIEDAFDFQHGSLGRITKEHGERVAQAFVSASILELLEDLNLTNTMSDRQILRASELICTEYRQLNPADLVVCFNMMRMGKFGKFYNRIDIQILAEALGTYWIERLDTAEHFSDRQHEYHKKDILLPEASISFEDFKKNRKELFEKLGWSEDEKGETDEAKYQEWRNEYLRQSVEKPEGWEPPTKTKHNPI